MSGGAPRLNRGGSSYHARQTGFGTTLSILPVILFVAFGSFFVYSSMGYDGMLIGLIGLFLGSIFVLLSFHTIQIPLLVWLLSLMGFRAIFIFNMPGLPDMTIDRLFMLWIIGVFMIKMVIEKKRLLGPFRLDILIALHGTYLLISCLYHNPASFNLWTKSYLMAYVAYFMGKNLINDIKWIRVVFVVLILMFVYYAETAIAEKYYLTNLVWPKWIMDRTIGLQVPGRSRGIFLQSGVLGTVMAMIMPLNFYFMQTTRNVLVKLLLTLSIAMGAAGLFFTYTRGSWLAGVVGLLVLFAIGIRKYGMVLGRFAAIAVILGMFGLLNPTQDKMYTERMENEDTIGNRVTVWAATAQIFRANPIFGSGFFTYKKVREQYVHTVDVPILGVIKASSGRKGTIHDIYMGVLAEEGLVGACLLISIYISIFKTFIKKYRYRKQGDHFAIYMMPPLAGLMIAYFVGGIAFDYRYFTTIPSLFYFFAGVVAGYKPAPLYEAPSKIIATAGRMG